MPTSLGHHHATKESAHVYRTKAFKTLGWASFALYWRQLGATWLANAPPKHESVYDVLLRPNGTFDTSERLILGLRNTAQRLKLISADPIVSAISSDVVFTAVALCVWAFVRNLSIDDLMGCGALSFLFGDPKTEKHVEIEKAVEAEPEVKHSPITPAKKGRGRPRKNGDVPMPTPAAPATGTLRRSTRRKARTDAETDHEDYYEPPAQVTKEIDLTDMDGSAPYEDAVAGGEAAALSLFLTFVGGLGQLAASVLGAEVAGSTLSGN